MTAGTTKERGNSGTVKNEIPVALTFDLDPDPPAATPGADGGEGKLRWRGVEEGVPAIREALDHAAKAQGATVSTPWPVTWFVRADDQIADAYGEPAAMFDRHGEILSRLESRGDEIAWHPHLHRRDSTGWRQERDEAALIQQMERAHAAIAEKGRRVQSARIGGNFGSNGVVATLETLGLAIDSTAMPGRARNDADYTFDWQTTPDHPYHPARADYRRPGEPAAALLEVPLSMAPVKAPYDTRPLRRYVDLAFRPEALGQGLSAHLASAPLLVTISHPAHLLPALAPPEPGLLAFDIAALKANLAAIVEKCRRQGRKPRFVTLAEAGRLAALQEGL
jgi:hypothetical protein